MRLEDIKKVCRNTPAVQVLCSRGLTVREVQFNRTPRLNTASPCFDPNSPRWDISKQAAHITKHIYDAAGYLASSLDPRLEASPKANFEYCNSLSGQPLRVDSVDAGLRVTLFDALNAPLMHCDGQDQRQSLTYDALHRVQMVKERKGDKTRVAERFFYGEKELNASHRNVRGQLVRHYDTAGRKTIGAYSLTGHPCNETRTLLAASEGESNWADPDSGWEKKLNAQEPFTTHWRTNALGEMLEQTDAKGNRQLWVYYPSGRLQCSTLTLASPQVSGDKLAALKVQDYTLVSELVYSAHGQIESEVAGNGVTSAYTYDPQTLCLTKSLAKDKSGVRQQLVYEYDPVGNILSIENQARAPDFFKNEKIESKATYAYDALYQLVRATGREQAGVQQSRQLPPLIHVPSSSTRVNYTHTYTYDQGRNLTEIRGERSNRFTQTLALANDSNRLTQISGIRQADDNINKIEYDINGNLKVLGTGAMQKLAWDGRNQLQHVIMLERKAGENDEELYQYDGNGQRVRKTTRTLAAGGILKDEVIYLPGLELRRHYDGSNKLTKELHLIVAQAGRAQVRVLHWEKGQPEKIKKNQIRYSLDNHLSSSMMELDQDAELLTYEEYYPYGGTAVWAAKNEIEAKYKYVRYSGKERDASGLYYYGFRYYAPWQGRWLNPDPAGTVDGLNLFTMVGNNAVSFLDNDGRAKGNSTKGGNNKKPNSIKANAASARSSGQDNAPPNPPQASSEVEEKLPKKTISELDEEISQEHSEDPSKSHKSATSFYRSMSKQEYTLLDLNKEEGLLNSAQNDKNGYYGLSESLKYATKSKYFNSGKYLVRFYVKPPSTSSGQGQSAAGATPAFMSLLEEEVNDNVTKILSLNQPKSNRRVEIISKPEDGAWSIGLGLKGNGFKLDNFKEKQQKEIKKENRLAIAMQNLINSERIGWELYAVHGYHGLKEAA